MPETFARTYARGPFAGMLGSGAATDRAAPVTPPGLPAVLWHQVADELRTQEQGRSLADLSLASRGARQIVREHLELHRYVQRFETALDSGSSLDRIMDDMLPVVYGGRDAGELTGGGVLSLPPDQREEMLKRMFKLTATHNYPKVYERLLEAIQTLPAPSQARVLTHAANNFGVNEHYAAEALMGNFRTPVAAIPELPARQQVAPLQALYDRSEWVRSVQAAQGEDMPRGWTIVRRVVEKAANKLPDGIGEELKAHIRNNPPDRWA